MPGTWSFVMYGALALSLLGCSSNKSSEEPAMKATIAGLNEPAAGEAAPGDEAIAAAPVQREGDEAPEYTKGGSNAAQVKATLRGKIIKKPWSKGGESWRAGGSEYYVLDVGSAQVEERTAEEGVILRPSDAVSVDMFDGAVGAEVEVSGVYVPDMPYEPRDPGEQYPMGMDGKPAPRGGGFKVTVLNRR